MFKALTSDWLKLLSSRWHQKIYRQNGGARVRKKKDGIISQLCPSKLSLMRAKTTLAGRLRRIWRKPTRSIVPSNRNTKARYRNDLEESYRANSKEDLLDKRPAVDIYQRMVSLSSPNSHKTGLNHHEKVYRLEISVYWLPSHMRRIETLSWRWAKRINASLWVIWYRSYLERLRHWSQTWRDETKRKMNWKKERDSIEKLLSHHA